MQSHQLNALLTESSSVKVATSQIGSDLVYGKAGSIVGDPSFIKTMVARVIFSNYGFFRRLILVIAGMGLKGWKDYKKEDLEKKEK